MKSELKSAADIRKERATKDNNKQKNMKKDKRTKFESSERKKKSAASTNKQFTTKAGQRKVKAILR